MRKTLSDSANTFVGLLGDMNDGWANLKRECGEILESVRARMAAEGWNTNIFDSPPVMIQMTRNRWPGNTGGAHYEVICDEGCLRQGCFIIFLHVENEVPDQAQVVKRLRGLLAPFSSKILKNLAPYAPSIPANPLHELIKAKVELENISVDSICNALHPIMETESFVDEAILLARGKPIFRTDLLWGQPRPSLIFEDKLGGQSFASGRGRFSEDCILVNGMLEGNHRPDENRPTHIMQLGVTKEFIEGQSIYFSCTIRTEHSARIWFYAEGPKDLNKWPSVLEPPAWSHYADVPGDPTRWQVIRYPFPGKKAIVQSYEGARFRETGAHVYLRSQTDDPELRIASIEYGVESDSEF